LSAIRRAQGARLKDARIKAGFKSARDAATKCGWPESTYRAHETGTRKIGDDDAERYARRFRSEGVRISARFIIFGAETGGSEDFGDRVSLDQLVEDLPNEEVSRIAEAIKLIRTRSR